MQCFARWNDDQEYGICFRDQTILQFGDSWELLASFVLLNPGSALPIDETVLIRLSQTTTTYSRLAAKRRTVRIPCCTANLGMPGRIVIILYGFHDTLPIVGVCDNRISTDETPQNEFLASKSLPFLVDGVYCKFSIDRLMRDLLGLYSSKYPGGVLKLYNLFNLKNQDVGRALAQFKEHKNHPDMFSHEEDIRFGSAPVVIASGGNAFADAALTNELKNYIALANPNQLYSLSRAGATSFAITKAKPDNNGIVEGNYHPSYTFHYGNSTTFT